MTVYAELWTWLTDHMVLNGLVLAAVVSGVMLAFRRGDEGLKD